MKYFIFFDFVEDLEGALVHMRKLVTYGRAEIDLKEDTR